MKIKIEPIGIKTFYCHHAGEKGFFYDQTPEGDCGETAPVRYEIEIPDEFWRNLWAGLLLITSKNIAIDIDSAFKAADDMLKESKKND